MFIPTTRIDRLLLRTLTVAALLLLPGSVASASPAKAPASAAGASPRFLAFLKSHPDFAEHLRSQRYEKAGELLDLWAAHQPADPEIPLARTHLLLAQGRLDEAWERARRYRGPEPADVFYAVGSFARQSVVQDKAMSPDRRAAVIDLGLVSLAMAIGARRDLVEAYTDRSLLLQERAKLTPDPEARQNLINEAERLRRQALEIQAKAREAKRIEEDIAGGKTLRPGGEVTRPEKVSGDLPLYTERAREERLSGVVLLELIIDKQGGVAEARVVRGMPEGLDRSALKALRDWRFQPATRKGKPVQVLVTCKVKFTPPDAVEVELE
ncbi:MAG: hypothetical protein QOH06_260 [Acidobacteriota bacterium]|jgi:TonB family protein|nr:hypothetical protein [Acidobacteriota bacterium]